MDNKYYTPTIDEFRVGFEYMFHTFENEWVPCMMTYEPVEIKNNYIISKKGYESFPLFGEMREYLENRLDRIRVKYLDEKDIESLGFMLREAYPEDQLIFPNNFYNVYSNNNSIQLTHYNWYTGNNKEYVAHVGIKIDYIGNGNENHITNECIFKGDIKNKSELKVLLKQLGI